MSDTVILWLTAAAAVGGERGREKEKYKYQKNSESQIRTNVCQVKRAAFCLMEEI